MGRVCTYEKIYRTWMHVYMYVYMCVYTWVYGSLKRSEICISLPTFESPGFRKATSYNLSTRTIKELLVHSILYAIYYSDVLHFKTLTSAVFMLTYKMIHRVGEEILNSWTNKGFPGLSRVLLALIGSKKVREEIKCTWVYLNVIGFFLKVITGYRMKTSVGFCPSPVTLKI